MIINLHMPANVLVTTIVVCSLMLLCLAGMMSMWELDTIVVTKNKYIYRQRSNIESLFVIYRNYPTFIDSTYQLYDSDEKSKLNIERHLWGLYELVTITTIDGNVSQTRMMGQVSASDSDCALYYSNSNNSVTLMGNTNIKGLLYLPQHGLVYGQMGDQFFKGQPVASNMVKSSESSLPRLNSKVVESVRDLMLIKGDNVSESNIDVSFNRTSSKIVNIDGMSISNCLITGNVILVGKSIVVDSTCKLKNVIVVASKIEVKDNFIGSAQLFAKDSLIIGTNVSLNYPSGLFSNRYIVIGDKSEVNGYVIVDCVERPTVEKPNYIQSRLSKVRGLIYVCGVAQLQGVISGAVYVDQAVYYSINGYYRHSLCDVSILANRVIAYPLWLGINKKREQILWLK